MGTLASVVVNRLLGCAQASDRRSAGRSEISSPVQSRQPVGSAGEAVTHFRDDAEDVARFVDGMVDVSAGLAFTVLAGIVMGLTNWAAAVVLVLPLAMVAVATKALDHRIKEYRSADRVATSAVTGLVGDTMAAATTVKVNDAIESGRAAGFKSLQQSVAPRRHATVVPALPA